MDDKLIQILDLVRSWVINIINSNDPLVLYSVCIFIFGVIMLLCFVNVVIYFSILLGLESQYVLNKIGKLEGLKYGWLLKKYINLYKKTQLGFIALEIILFLYVDYALITTSYTIFTGYK